MPLPNPSATRRRTARGLALAAALLVGGAWLPSRAEDDVSLASCPEAVQATILGNLHGGKVDEIKRIEVDDRVLYIVEIDRKAAKDIKLHISGTGALLKTVEEVRLRDLPEAVRTAVAGVTAGGGRASDIDRVVVEERVEYHVQVRRPKGPKLRFVFDEAGVLLGQK
jgi:hypothetical protein